MATARGMTAAGNVDTGKMNNGDPLKPANNNSSKPYGGGQPKFGTLVPNRIYVGGISGDTTETDLSRTFAEYGNVISSKIIMDRSGVSKGYGFVTFQTEEEAQRLQADVGSIILKNRTLSIAPAIKKPTFAKYGGNNYMARPSPAMGGAGIGMGYAPAAADVQPSSFYPYSMPYQHTYLPWMAMDDQHNPAAAAAAAAAGGWGDGYHGIYHY